MLTLILGLLLMDPAIVLPDAGLYVHALWLLHQHGSPVATQTQHDGNLKSTLVSALAHDRAITFNELGIYMSLEKFRALAGRDEALDAGDITQALEATVPPTRTKLTVATRSHAEYLTTTFDMIDEPHREAAERLGKWMIANYQAGKSLDIIVVCTGNSRRSILGSSMGNLAAAYYGLTDIRFHSGGTAPSAFNSRTVQALQAIGFDIQATGQEAARGELTTANPIYRIRWGDGLETHEFSKHFADPLNPQMGFAAVMVCTEADNECPNVAGAALRLSMPYADPKAYDDSGLEPLKYAERRDDIGRTLLSVMCQVRRALDTNHGE